MIDFKNKKIFKLKPDDSYGYKVSELLVGDERLVASYKSMRDGIVFTDKRMIIVNIQGLTGKKWTTHPFLTVR